MTRPALALLLVLAPLLAACSPRRAADLLAGGRAVRTGDVAYGTGARQRLDVYRPRGSGRRPAPVVIFLYGGRWQSGSKERYALVGGALARRGLVAVVPDVRLAPDAVFPDWVEDAALAVRWTRDNAARFGGDPAHLVVVGHSAGGHTAALLALDERYLARAGVPAVALRGAVSLAGPVDTTWTDADVQALMGPRDGWPASYPANQIGGGEPPLLLLHGADDATVLPLNSGRLARRVRDRGGCARAVVYPGVGHIRIAVALALPALSPAPVLDDVARFARRPAADTCPPGRVP